MEKEKNNRSAKRQLAKRGSPADDGKRHLGLDPPGRGLGAAPLRESEGRALTSEAKPSGRNELRCTSGMGEYREFAYPHSPDPVLGHGASRSFGCASLVGRCPTPRWWRCPQAPARRTSPPGLPRSHSLASYASLFSFFIFLFSYFLIFPSFPWRSLRHYTRRRTTRWSY